MTSVVASNSESNFKLKLMWINSEQLKWLLSDVNVLLLVTVTSETFKWFLSQPHGYEASSGKQEAKDHVKNKGPSTPLTAGCCNGLEIFFLLFYIHIPLKLMWINSYILKWLLSDVNVLPLVTETSDTFKFFLSQPHGYEASSGKQEAKDHVKTKNPQLR